MSPLSLAAIAFGTLSAGFLGWSLFTLSSGFVQARWSFLNPGVITAQGSRNLTAAALGSLGCLALWLGFGSNAGVISILLIAFSFFILQYFPAWRRNQQKAYRLGRMRDLFPQTLAMALQALKTGQTVPQVIEYLSRESPSPLREEWNMVSAEMSLGSSAERALAKMGEAYPPFKEFHQFLESYRISRSTGANLTQLMQVLVEDMEEKARILRKMDSMTAQARLSGWMVGLLPFLLGFVFFLLDPALITPLFTESAGIAILLLAATLEFLGFLWIRQLLRLET